MVRGPWSNDGGGDGQVSDGDNSTRGMGILPMRIFSNSHGLEGCATAFFSGLLRHRPGVPFDRFGGEAGVDEFVF